MARQSAPFRSLAMARLTRFARGGDCSIAAHVVSSSNHVSFSFAGDPPERIAGPPGMEESPKYPRGESPLAGGIRGLHFPACRSHVLLPS